MEEDLPIQKVTISGPTLSSLINRFTSSEGDISGLLFGHFSLSSPPSLSDDSPSPSSPSPSSLIATITSFISSTTTTSHPNHRLIGWFSGRRRSPLRPSLSDFTFSHSLSSSSSPLIFLLLTTPFPDPQTLIHTHDYKAFHFNPNPNPNSLSFDPLPLTIVNIGPAFRGQYGAFCPNSHLPYLPCDLRVGSPMREDGKEKERGKENLSQMKRVSKDQKDLDCYAEGFPVANLNRLIGSEAVSYMSGVEDLYEKMLTRLDSLSKLVESSSLKVLQQENHNMKLRHRIAGIE